MSLNTLKTFLPAHSGQMTFPAGTSTHDLNRPPLGGYSAFGRVRRVVYPGDEGDKPPYAAGSLPGYHVCPLC